MIATSFSPGSYCYQKVFFRPFSIALLHPALALIAASAGVISWGYPLSLSAPITGICIFFIGTRFRAINNMSHECFHRTFSANSKINDFFGYFFATLEFSKFLSIKKEHFAHHAFLGDYSKDGDLGHLEKYGFHEVVSAQAILKHLKNALSLKHVPDYLFIHFYEPGAPWWAFCLRMLYGLGLISLALLFPVQVVVFFALPFCTAYQIQKYLTDYLDHGGLLGRKNTDFQSRNFIINNSVLRWILFPRNDCYHLVHHLYPSIPVEQLDLAHQALLSVPEYGALRHHAVDSIAFLIRGSR